MKCLKVRVVFAVGIACIAVTLSSRSGPPANAISAAGEAVAAPKWELKDVDGRTVRSSDFKGKVVVLDFWATWCGPCRVEIPGFVALQKAYAPQGLVVVGAAVDDGGATAVKQFAQKLGMNYTVVLADEKVQQSFGGIEAIPTTFIIDRAGRIVKKHFGFADKDEFEREIRPLLNPGTGSTGIMR